MRGCGIVRSGSSSAQVVVQQHVDVERARAPAFAAHALRVAPRAAARARAARADRGRCRSRRRRSGTRPAAGRRPARSRRRARPRRRATPSARASASTARCRCASRSPRFEPSARYARASRHRSMRTPTWSTPRAHRRLQLAHLDDDALHARVGAAHLGDARREPFEQLVVLGRDDPADRVAHRAVVDGVVERRRSRPPARGRRGARGRPRTAAARTCSSGSTPCTPSSRIPAMRMRSTSRR